MAKTTKQVEPLKGQAAQKARMRAQGRRDLWLIDPADIRSPREDESNEEHAQWLARTDPNDADMKILLESMRQHGTDEGEPILVYTDGGVLLVADGDRRTAACRIVNAERKAKRLPPLLLTAKATRDPVLARALGNTGRKDDPPLVLARRFRSALGSMEPSAAAAAVGLRLDTANMLVKCLALPADLQAKVNARALAPDVAVRAAKGGSEAVRAVMAKATGPDGKVDPRKAKAAAREATPPRPRALPRHEAEEFAQRLAAEPKYEAAHRVARYLLGDRTALDGFPGLQALAARAECATRPGATPCHVPPATPRPKTSQERPPR